MRQDGEREVLGHDLGLRKAGRFGWRACGALQPAGRVSPGWALLESVILDVNLMAQPCQDCRFIPQRAMFGTPPRM